MEKEVVDSLLSHDNDSSESDSDYEPVVLPSSDSTKKKAINVKKEPAIAIKQEYNNSDDYNIEDMARSM